MRSAFIKRRQVWKLRTEIPEGLQVVDDRAFTADGWSKESGDQFIEGTGMWCRPECRGNCEVYRNESMACRYDRSEPRIRQTYISTATRWRLLIRKSDKRKLQQRIFESDTLKEGKHTLKIVNTGTGTEAIGVDAALVLNNGGKGMFQIEYPSYRVNENTKTPIMVKRLGEQKAKLRYSSR